MVMKDVSNGSPIGCACVLPIDEPNGVPLRRGMAIEHDLDSPFAEAVRRAGSQSAFGRLINKTQSTVRGWLVEGKDLPAEHVLVVEAATGVSRHDLRPDIYPRELDAAPLEGLRA
jgi:DNA-binding transcriptional regulator YdaS (Cro superfamily)